MNTPWMEVLNIKALIFVILINISAALAKQGPPEVRSRLQHKQVTARVGDAVELTCPVTMRSRPFIEWFHEGEAVRPRQWRKYKQFQNYLQIKNVDLEDSGKFKCVAINGFGSVEFQMLLEVESGQNIPHRRPSSAVVIPEGESKPVFLQVTKNHRTIIQRPVGSSVRLKCRAEGNPSPTITWLKDDVVLAKKDLNHDSNIGKFTLHLMNLHTTDSGKYTCRLSNKWGSINTSFPIEVIDEIRDKPQLVGPHPVDTAVMLGGSASLLCQMRSEAQKPAIQWLKEVGPSNKTEVIKLQDRYFKVLTKSDVVKGSDGMYRNKLIIKDISIDDAGTYVCVGANHMGYSHRMAQLSVIPEPTRANIARAHIARPTVVEDAPVSNHSDYVPSVDRPIDKNSITVFSFATVIVLFLGIIIFVVLIKVMKQRKKGSTGVENPITVTDPRSGTTVVTMNNRQWIDKRFRPMLIDHYDNSLNQSYVGSKKSVGQESYDDGRYTRFHSHIPGHDSSVYSDELSTFHAEHVYCHRGELIHD